MRLLIPSIEHLPSYIKALETGWSPNNMRPEAAQEELARIHDNPESFLTSLDSSKIAGDPIPMLGLSYVEITTSHNNVVSKRIIETNGGVLIEEFPLPAAYGEGRECRYRILLAA